MAKDIEKYTVRVKHDKGTVKLNVTVIMLGKMTDDEAKEKAIQQVMAAEGCPRCAILSARPAK